MDGTQDVLGDRLHGDGSDVGVAVGLEDALGVRAVRLVPGDVGSDLVRREEHDLVAEALESPAQWWAEPQASMTTVDFRACAKKTSSSPRDNRRCSFDTTRLLGHGELENGLCDVHRDDGMLFHGLLLFLARGRLWHMMPIETQGGVHSINEADEGTSLDKVDTSG